MFEFKNIQINYKEERNQNQIKLNALILFFFLISIPLQINEEQWQNTKVSIYLNKSKIFLQILNTDCYIFDRKSYEKITDFFFSNNIVKQIYVSRIKSIMIFCNDSDFSQVFVYDIPSKNMIGKINQFFRSNDVGVVVDFIYDGEYTQVVYLDEYGNLQVNSLFLSFETINNIKLIEMSEREEKALGLTIDYTTNLIHAYSKKTLYKVSYGQLNDVYQYSLQQNKGLYAMIDKTDLINNNQLHLQYLMIRQNNIIMKYQNYQIIYQQIYEEEIIDIKYLNKNQQVIIAFSNHLKIYNNYSYDVLYYWDNYVKSEEVLFEKFIDDDVFITFNKTIIHYDFKNTKILNQFQLNLKSKITSHLTLSSNQKIIFGFQDSQILLYDKINFKGIFISNQQFVEFQNKSIKFILEIDSLSFYVSTIEGQIIEYNINSNQIINTYELIKLVKLNKSHLALSDLKYEKQQKRLIFIFIGQYEGYIWGFKENKIISYFSSGNLQKSNIQLTNKYIIVSSGYQLNFYERFGESKFFGMIYGNAWYDQLQGFKFIESDFIIVALQSRYILYYISDQNIQVIEMQNTYYPFILEYSYNQNKKHLYFTVLTQEGIVEEMVNVQQFIDQKIQPCQSQIKSNETQLIQIQFSKIQEEQDYDYIFNLRNHIPSTQSEVFFNVGIESEFISFLNKLLKKSKLQQQTIISPIEYIHNNYIIQQSSFTQLEQQKFYMKDFQLQFNEDEKQEKFNDINFNSQTKFIIWQNISFANNYTLKGMQINFINLTEVILFDIRISSQNLGFSGYKSVYSDSNSLFYFENIERLYIYNLYLEYNSFTRDSDYQNIFFMKSIKQIYIQNVFINNNKGTINILRFDLIDQINIESFQIQNNQQIYQNNLKFIIFILSGCSEIVVSGIKFANNELIQFIQTVNYYELDKQIIIYTKDVIKLFNLTISENKFNLEQIIDITQSFIYFTNVKYISNEGNIKINDPKNITVEGSTFSNNKANNGGAIAVYNLKQNFTLRKTSIIQNQALGNGGGVYLENIQSQDIEFSDDCHIQQNSALIGGGVRIINKSTKQIKPHQYPFKKVVTQNKAELYGDNSCTFLSNILIENGNVDSDQTSNNTFRNLTNYQFKYQIVDINDYIQDQKGFLGYLQIGDFKSGGNLYLNIFFIDENQKKLQFNEEKLKLNKYPDDIIEELESLSIVFTKGSGNENSIILTGETILNHNLYQENCKCFQIKQLTISSIPSQTKLLQIQFQANKFINQIYQTMVIFEFRKCQIGEVIQLTSNSISTCNFCQDGTYSLIDPNSINENQDQILCKKCPDSAIKCIGNLINLKNGYWRKDNNVDEIIACNSQIGSCKSEDPESKGQGCTKGFVGPLCEVCDLEGIVWTGQYVPNMDGVKCNECSNNTLQYVFIAFQCIGILVFLIFNSFKSFESVQYSQICYYLRQLQLLPISRVQLSSLQTSFIKVFVSYLQLSSLLASQTSLLPFQMNIMQNLFGSSNKTITLSMSCIIPKDMVNKYGKAFVLCIANFILPLIFILFCLVIFNLFKDFLFNARHQRKYIVFMLLTVLYMFFLSDTVQFFTFMLTCRQIGSFYYNTVDLLQQCNEEKLGLFLKVFSATILSFWTLIPLVLLYFLRKKKNKLDHCSQIFKYGYFYLEAKNKYFYWEFVRIVLKLLVIIVNTLLKSEYVQISRLIIILMFTQYIKLVTQLKPFQSKELIAFELLSIQLIIGKILLQASRETFFSVKIFFEILSLFLDYYFISYFILSIKSLSGKILQFILKRICSQKIYKKLTKMGKTNFITYIRWKKIKNSLQDIIKNKATYNMSVLYDQISNSKFQLQQQMLLSRQSSGINLLSSQQLTNRRLNNQKYIDFLKDSLQKNDEVLSSLN